MILTIALIAFGLWLALTYMVSGLDEYAQSVEQTEKEKEENNRSNGTGHAKRKRKRRISKGFFT